MFYACKRWANHPLAAGKLSHSVSSSRGLIAGNSGWRWAAASAGNSHAPFEGTPMCWSANAVFTATRPFISMTRPAFQASSTTSGNVTSATAMDIAIQVNKLKKAHQSSAGPVKKEVEREAWLCLQNGLTEETINKAEGKAVALLLNSWAYFAKYWEKGKDGPLIDNEEAPSSASTSSQPESNTEQTKKSE